MANAFVMFGKVDSGIPVIGSTRVRVGASIADTAAAFWHGKIRDVVVTNLLSAEKATALSSILLARRQL